MPLINCTNKLRRPIMQLGQAYTSSSGKSLRMFRCRCNLAVLVWLRTGMEEPVDIQAKIRGWLLEWGDIIALVCIILCVIDTAARATAAVWTGLRNAMDRVQCLLNAYRQTSRATLEGHKTAPARRTQGNDASASEREEIKGLLSNLN